MGDNLAIVNGSVTIEPSTTMDMAKVQEVADVILTVQKTLQLLQVLAQSLRLFSIILQELLL